MNERHSGEKILRRMFHRSVGLNYLGAMTVMLNTAVDGMIISHFLGGKAAAAFGLVMPVYSLLNLFPCLVKASAQARLGLYIGRGDLKSADRCIFYLLLSGLIAAVPLTLLLSALRGWTLAVLSARMPYADATVSMASEYLLWLTPAVFPLMLCPALHPVMQMDGDALHSPRAIQVATFVNLSVDVLNALVFHGGMAGMALATTLSCYSEFGVLLLHFRRPQSILRPSPGGSFSPRQIMQLTEGTPMLLRELFAFFSGILLNRLASVLGGEDAVAVLAIGGSVWVFLLPAAMAVSGTCMTLGSISAGEADAHALRTVCLLGVWYSVLPCAIYALLFAALSRPLAVFCAAGNARLMGMAQPYLCLLSLTLPFVCFCQTMEAQLVIGGRLRRSAVLGILDGGVLVLAASWLLGRSMGLRGLWLGRLVGSLLLALAALAVSFRRAAFGSGKRGFFPTPGETADASLEATLCTPSEVVAFSEKLRTFCSENGLSLRVSNMAALCAEEMACNSLQWGYAEKENLGVDLRAVYRDGALTLRFRDTGKRFDPARYVRQFQAAPQDPGKNVGLRIVSGMAADMRYISLVDCNVVMLTF